MKRFIISVLFVFLMAFALAAADDLSGSMSSESGDPGSTVTFDISYTNTGTTDISISSTSTSLSDGTNTISAPSIGSITVPAGSSATVSFSMTVPSTAAGIYTGTLTGTDASNSANTESLSYSLTVNSVDSFTPSEGSLSFDLQNGDESQTFSITNDGSTTLSLWSISFTSSDGDSGEILDNDDDAMTISFSGASDSLSPGSSMSITATADPDSEMDVGSYSGTISISATGTTTDTATLSLSATVNVDACEEGRQGSDFEIDIRNPDNGDDFAAGETIPMEIKIENQANEDLDVDLEVTLYNMDTGDKETVHRESGTIDEDETETFSFDFELPTDLDEDDDYEIFVQVHEEGNEEDSCDYESIDIDIDREDEDAHFQEVSISPEVGLVCGDEYRVSVYVESTGADDVNDLYVEVQDGDLGIQESSESFDLGDYNSDENEEKLSFDFTIPEDIAAGIYSLEAILFDNNGDLLDSELVNIEVTSCTEEDLAGDLTLDISEDYTVEGSELTLAMLISNTGDEESTITVDLEEVSWATFTGSEYLDTLQPGDEIHAYVYLTLDDTTTEEHDIKITVTDDLGNEVSEIVTVDFGEKPVEEEKNSGFFEGLTEKSPGSLWILVDIILVILAIVFIRMLFRKK